jgi:hypothetical protein
VNGAQSYDVYRWNGATWDKINSSNIPALIYADTGPANGKTTYYRVVAKIGTVGSDLGKSPQATGMRLGVPSNPSAVWVSKAELITKSKHRQSKNHEYLDYNKYTIQWTQPYDEEVSSYTLFYQVVDMGGGQYQRNNHGAFIPASFDNIWRVLQTTADNSIVVSNIVGNSVTASFRFPQQDGNHSTKAYRFLVRANSSAAGSSTSFSQHVPGIGYKFPDSAQGQDDSRTNYPVAVTGWVSHDGYRADNGWGPQVEYQLYHGAQVHIQEWLDGEWGYPLNIYYHDYEGTQIPLAVTKFGYLKGANHRLVKGWDGQAKACTAQEFLYGQCGGVGYHYYYGYYYYFIDGVESKISCIGDEAAINSGACYYYIPPSGGD